MKIFKFSNLWFLRFFLLQKHEIYQKPLKIPFFVLYDIIFIQNRQQQQLFELAYKLKYYALLFLESILGLSVRPSFILFIMNNLTSLTMNVIYLRFTCFCGSQTFFILTSFTNRCFPLIHNMLYMYIIFQISL